MKHHRRKGRHGHAPAHPDPHRLNRPAQGESAVQVGPSSPVTGLAAAGPDATRADHAASAGADPNGAFEALLAQCPAPFQGTVRWPPLRSPAEITSYRTRLIMQVGAFGTDLPARAWGPLRDLAIAEVEADRYAGAIGGIVRQSRLTSLADLLVQERTMATRLPTSGVPTAADTRAACERLARAWIAGAPQAQADVETRLARLGLTVSAIDDIAHAGALQFLTHLERMRTNAQRTAARNRKLLEELLRNGKQAAREKYEPRLRKDGRAGDPPPEGGS